MPGRDRSRRILRALLLAALLLGPLIGAELFARSSIELMVEDFRRYHSAADARKLLFGERDGSCPEYLVLGTSVSDRTLIEQFMEVEHHSTFSFAAGGMRPNNLLLIWRWVVDQGCVPDRLLLELSPLMLNVREGGKVHDVGFLSARAWWRLPDGFTKLRRYTAHDLADSFTYDRLLLLRRRREIGHAIDRHTGLGKLLRGPGPEQDRRRKRGLKPLPSLPLHGQLRAVKGGGMTSKEHKIERKRRRRSVKQGKWKHLWSDVQLDGYRTLVAEARSDGAQIVLHTPPMSTIYLEVLDDLEAKQPWCEFATEFEGQQNRWHRALADPDYDDGDFFDWYHLDRKNSARYARDLMAAVRTDVGWADDGWCD